MLHVIESASEIAADGGRGRVVVESDCGGPPFTKAFAELESQDTRNLALNWAGTHGISSASLNGFSSAPYPVNVDGRSMEAIRGEKGEALPQNHQKMQPARYRVDVPVCRPAR